MYENTTSELAISKSEKIQYLDVAACTYSGMTDEMRAIYSDEDV
jgi:hypothetical protein